MGKNPEILFVDDDHDIRELFKAQFKEKYGITLAETFDEVHRICESREEPFDILITDQHLGQDNGLEIVKYFKIRWPDTVRIVISGYKNFDRLVRAINEGEIHRFVIKPWSVEDFDQSLQTAYLTKTLRSRNKALLVSLKQTARDLENKNVSLTQQKHQLSVLLSVLHEIHREPNLLARLDLIVQGIIDSQSFRRAIIYLVDDDFGVKAFRYAGLSEKEIEQLQSRRPLTPRQRRELLQEKYRHGNSYFIPYDDPQCPIADDQSIGGEEASHYFPRGDWHPRDILLIPLHGKDHRLVGLLSVDDPCDGQRPKEQDLHMLELFAHEAGLIIEQEEIRLSMENTQQLMESQNIELRGKKLMFHSLLSLNYLTRKTINLDIILHSFKDYLIALFNADTFHLLLENKRGYFFVKSAFIPNPEGEGHVEVTYNAVFEPEDAFISNLHREKRPIYVNSVSHSGSLHSLFNNTGVKSLFAAPLVYNEKILGILTLGFRDKRNISLKLLEDFELFSNQLAGIVYQETLIRQQQEGQRERYLSTIQALAKAIEKKDPYTRNHCDMVRKYSLLIAERAGLSEEAKHQLEIASILHDIGKIGISIGILNKQTPLDDDEYEVIKKHPEIGEEILDSLPDFEQIRTIIRHHQERFDGKGYPDGLAGQDIPVESRILAIADAFDAMTSDRPYRKALSVEQAMKELKQHSGIQWDPDYITLFTEVVESEAKKGTFDTRFSTHGNGSINGFNISYFPLEHSQF